MGETCEYDWDCESGNCSALVGICRVAIGTPCTIADCDLCLRYDDGTSRCSRRCGAFSGSIECGDAPGYECIGNTRYDYYECFPWCDPEECPVGCAPLTGGGSYCPCDSGCRREPALPGNLQPCAGLGTAPCASGECLGTMWQAPGESQSLVWGYCAEVCSTDADCGGEGRCVDVPCASAGDTCGLRCLPACDPTVAHYCQARAARCEEHTDADGSTVTACTVRNPPGTACTVDTDCMSGRCTGSNRCE